jgi:hypothetical protein
VKKRTINCEAGYGEIHGDTLVLIAWRGQETLKIKLKIGDHELVDLCEKAADLSEKRYRAYHHKATYLRENIKGVAGRIAA